MAVWQKKTLELVWLAVLMVVAWYVGIGMACGQDRYFGVYSDGSTPVVERMDAQAGWTNVLNTVQPCAASELAAAQARGFKVACEFPWNWATYTRKADGTYQETAASVAARPDFLPWVWSIQPYASAIATMRIADEPEHGKLPLGQWNYVNGNEQSARLDAFHDLIRRHFPTVPTSLVFTAAYAYWFSLPNAGGVRLPARVDWIGMDSYYPWNCGYGCGISHGALIDAMARWMAPHQRLMLVPQGMLGYGIWNEQGVVDVARQYLAFAEARPRVVFVTPFIWETRQGEWFGMRDSPQVLREYQAIGRRWLRMRPAQVTGVRIEREP